MITSTPFAFGRSVHRMICGLILAAVTILTVAAATGPAASRKNYDLPAGDAAKTLKSFSDQSGEQIVYPAELVRGLKTNAVQGELTAREALDRMLDKSGLIAVQDEKTGALAVRKSPPARDDAPPTPRTEPVPAETPAPARNSAPATSEKEILVLSPFEVSASDDQGYAAATTLAGNRLSTQLRDVGSAISVVTAQMLSDLGATSNESLLQYTTNTEVGNIYGNMANVGTGQVLDEKANLLNPNSNTRIRGLASADNTIDFFLTDIPWNGYNTSRVDMQRGPNAILFGLGSPAGIINAAANTAGFKNRGKVELRYSQFGSVRTTFDYNFVVLPDELAVRVDLLRDDERFKQDPAYQRDERAYVALRYEPGFLSKGSAKTILRANYEMGRVRANRPRVTPPGDSITQWWYTGTAQGYTADGTPRQFNNLNKMGFNQLGLQDSQTAVLLDPTRGAQANNLPNGTPSPVNQPWLGGQYAANFFGNPLAIFDGTGNSAPRLLAVGPNQPRGINSLGVIDGNIRGFPNGSTMSSITTYRDWTRKTQQPGAFYGFTKNLLLTDPSIFDFYNNLIDGPNKKEWQNFDRFNVNLAQTFLGGNAGFELAYDSQNYDNGQLTIIADRAFTLYIDVIKTLADGSTNPNFGRPFVGDTVANNVANASERSSARVTAFVKHDFAAHNDSLLHRILGQHTLTAFANKDTRKIDSRNFVRYSADLAYKDLVAGVGATSNFNDNNRVIFPAFYLGPSLESRNAVAGSNIPRIASELTVPQGTSIRAFDSTWSPPVGVNPGDVWTNTFWPEGNANRISTQSENPANYRGWINAPFNFLDSEQGNRDALTRFARLDKSTVQSKALVYNGSFYKGTLVGMYGYREDTAKAYTYTGVRLPVGGPINLDPSNYRLPETPRDTQKLTSKTWSLVAHVTEMLPNNPLPFEVSVFYNKSENFSAAPGRVGLYGENLGPPRGNTTDQGIMISSKGGKYSLRINKYVSVLKNASSTAGFANTFFIQQLFTTYQPLRNIYFYKIDTGQDLSTTQGNNPDRWTWQPTQGMTLADTAAQQTASITAWDALVASLSPAFYSAYRFDLNNLTNLGNPSGPSGLTLTEDSISKGYEAELYASPIKGLRLTLNVSKSEATRDNQGEPSWIQVVNTINTALNSTAAGLMRDNSSAGSGTALNNWNNNFWAPWQTVKTQDGGAVGELRKWRSNAIANYEFQSGRLKGLSLGAAYRWQDKVVIGWRPIYLDVNGNPAANPQVSKVGKLDFAHPYYGPAETNIDLWVGYSWKLKGDLRFRTQLNVSNVGKGNSLIPITTQPDGTPAGWRIAPTQIWRLTNTLEF